MIYAGNLISRYLINVATGVMCWWGNVTGSNLAMPFICNSVID